jgi:ABC-2 type transport system permease protein
MLRPYQFIFYHLADSTGTILVKVFCNGLLGILLAWLFAGPLQGFTPQQLPFLLILYAGSFLLNFFLQTCLGLTAFWLEDNSALYWIYSKLALILGVLLPLDICPAWMQRILRFLPFPYLFYGPARLTIAFSGVKWLEIFTGQFGYLVLAVGLSFLIFSRGKRKVVLNGG